MIATDNLRKAIDLGIIKIDEQLNRITYRLGSERYYQWSHPEEKVRVEIILELIFNYSYPPLRITTEQTIPGRTPTNFADVVVFSDDRRRNPYIAVEVASPTTSPTQEHQKIEQLFGYANALSSDYAVYFDGSHKLFWRVSEYGGLEREENRISDLPKNYGDVPIYTYIRGQQDLETVSHDNLSRIFDQCHNELWGGGRLDPTEAFDEMSKLMFAKLFDEQNTSIGSPYEFQKGAKETDVMVSERVLSCYAKAQSKDSSVFAARIRSEPHKIAAVVRNLQHVSLSETDMDAKGRAYEQFLGEVFRGKLGQYFTRREIVEFLVDLAEPNIQDIILDPACGSGGFLIYAMKKVFTEIESLYPGEVEGYRHKSNFAQSQVYGIEINEKIARVSMMDMVVNEDGHTNVVIGTAFNNTYANNSIRDGKFTLILTNPPFGDSVKQDDRDKLGNAELENYELFNKSRNKSIKSEILFLERCARFLCEKGRLGIVIPDGILSNTTAKYVREFLLENFHIDAIVTLPSFAFLKSGSGIKTSLLFARKRHVSDIGNREIFMSIAKHIGYDATARKDDNELPAILEHYRSRTGTLEDRIVRIPREKLTGNLRLDPLYYYLEPIINQAFAKNVHPVFTLYKITEGRITSGKSPKGGAKYSMGPIPIILVGNIAKDGRIDFSESYSVAEGFYEENREKAAVGPFDILIAKDGATTGKVGIIPEDFSSEKCLINEHIFKLTVDEMLPGDSPLQSEDQTISRKRLNALYIFFLGVVNY